MLKLKKLLKEKPKENPKKDPKEESYNPYTLFLILILLLLSGKKISALKQKKF